MGKLRVRNFLHTPCHGVGVPRVGSVRENFGGLAILAGRRTLTGSRGKYFRVVRIHSDCLKEREISLVRYPFQIISLFPTRPNARNLHFGGERMRSWPPEVFRTRPNNRNSWHTTPPFKTESASPGAKQDKVPTWVPRPFPAFCNMDN